MEAGRIRKHERVHGFGWPGLDLEALISTRSFAESHPGAPARAQFRARLAGTVRWRDCWRKNRDYLDGYRSMRSAASHSIWDIVAIGLKDIVLCQVKTGDWPGTVDPDALKLFPAPPHARKVIHRSRVLQRKAKIRGI
jgi:hypothetical protein